MNPCTQVTIGQAIQVSNVDKVDLLLMVDNSGSMKEEQTSLAAEIPRLITILASGDFNQDGDNCGDGQDPGETCDASDDNDFEPVKDLHVGVISSDMGVGGHQVMGCVGGEFGDDGVLLNAGDTSITGCMATYPRFLSFQPPANPDQIQMAAMNFGRDVNCVATLGTSGCGFEQQLEAILKALTPANPQPWTSSSFQRVGSPGASEALAVPFFRSSSPHGDRTNEGFIRENSVLAIIPVTDEEDCSAQNLELFNQDNPEFSQTILNLRCFTYPEELHPIERYVDGLLQLRTRPGLLIYAPITGIPVDLAPTPGGSINYERLVGPDSVRDPRMIERIDESRPMRDRLVTSCSVVGRGDAYPPVRIVRVARALEAAGAGVTVQSICQESYRNALTDVILQIKSALGAACLPRELNLEADGTVRCDVVAELPAVAGMSPAQVCSAGYAGSVPKMNENGPVLTAAGGPVCVLPQLAPEEHGGDDDETTESGWFYDDFTDDAQMNCQDGAGEPFQRITFTSQPPSGATVRLECFQAVQGGGGDAIQIGTFCDPMGQNSCPSGTSPEGTPLTCDPVSRSCGVGCDTDADCRTAGLIGFVCDTRPLSVVSPNQFPGNSDAYKFCVNPTCGS